ncbi:hypothetical protein Ahy_A03g011846 [Arachis hypogaea]|uniref:Uncharacterized protein n=1 Tax=Arachis hypogaea TaxID=3818 RepID=A0A445DRW5_ARAHY|nr:hypothetical protein Ahy_A03g011846 [Arachis hypogaea]
MEYNILFNQMMMYRTMKKTKDELVIYLAACNNGFKAGCRPFIKLDAIFLKCYFGGQLLTINVMMGVKHIFCCMHMWKKPEQEMEG